MILGPFGKQPDKSAELESLLGMADNSACLGFRVFGLGSDLQSGSDDGDQLLWLDAALLSFSC